MATQGGYSKGHCGYDDLPTDIGGLSVSSEAGARPSTRTVLLVLLVAGVLVMAWFWNRSESWDLGLVEPPWDDRTSIHDYIARHVVPGKPDLAEGGESLPDEKDDGGVRWAAGAMDGVMGHHMGPGKDKKRARKTKKALEAVLLRATSENVAALYALLMNDDGALGYLDHLIEALASKQRVDVERLEQLASWLATKAPDREPVKFAIAMLGIVPSRKHEDIILTLGRHDEFTLYAAVALSNTSAKPERSLFELAKGVSGWGRVHIVERLAETQDPEIKAWMLRDGYQNSIMYEYLAYTCATTGGLLAALDGDSVDTELLVGAGEIIGALINGGPAEDIDDYKDGAAVVDRFVDLLGSQPNDIRHLIAVDSIKSFLEEDTNWDERAKRGWTPQLRERVLERIKSLLVLPHWQDLVQTGLQAKDATEFFNAQRAAGAIGVDVWDAHFTRLKSGEDDGWYYVMQTDDPGRIDRVVALAKTKLPLDKIATGPGNELGMGLEWNPHRNLSFVLQELGRFPGKGWDLVRTGIRSPVVNNRHMALRALSAWGQDAWPEGGEDLLRRALADEPDEQVLKGLETLLAGGKIEDPHIDADNR